MEHLPPGTSSSFTTQLPHCSVLWCLGRRLAGCTLCWRDQSRRRSSWLLGASDAVLHGHPSCQVHGRYDDPCRKVVFFHLQQYMHYQQALQYANEKLTGKIALVTHGDIYFGAGLERLQPRHLAHRVLALSRHERAKNSDDICCSAAYSGCHDAFAFLPPLPPSLVAQSNFQQALHLLCLRLRCVRLMTSSVFQNVWGAENLLLYLVEKSGLQFSNPCLDIVMYHNHNSNLRKNQNPQRVNVDGKSRIAIPTFLDDFQPWVYHHNKRL